MDNRRVVWDKDNRRHIEREHSERAITAREVDEVLGDPNRIEGPEDIRAGRLTGPSLDKPRMVVGCTSSTSVIREVAIRSMLDRLDGGRRGGSRNEVRGPI